MDVEDWNNAALLLVDGTVVPPTPAVVRNCRRLLDLFLEHQVKATWFVLGEIAHAFPRLLRDLADAGQEIGVHGYHHHSIFELSEASFRYYTRRAKDAVEQAAGVPACGYRAAAFSISERTPWAFAVLAELGFRYDSSIFPVRSRRYGRSDAPLLPYRVQTASGPVLEVPLSAAEIAGIRLPCCGGGYLRHFPLWYTRWALRNLASAKRPALFYLHPYEIETEFDAAFFREHLPRQARLRFARLRCLQYRNRHRTVPKLRWLLQRHRFAPIATVFETERATAPATSETLGSC